MSPRLRQPFMGRLSASFRDPSGFVFTHEGKVYRQVNSCYRPSYDQLMSSGLYDDLSTKGWLIPHIEIPSLAGLLADERAYKLIHPKQIPYVSFPYEWSFNQLKDAALLTLKIAAAALQKNISKRRFRLQRSIHWLTASFYRHAFLRAI